MIVFEKVTKKYENPECIAVSDFSERIKPGEFVALTGKSGSGKTTLLSLILKEIEPTSGRIMVDGKDIGKYGKRNIPQYRSSLGVIFQDFKLVADMNAYDNVKLAYMLSGGRMKDSERRISSVFSMLGIENLHKRLPKEMSGGQQQKVCLARAIVNQPRILLADEPTGNLDENSSGEIFSLFRLINEQKITILMATHDLNMLKTVNAREINLDK